MSNNKDTNKIEPKFDENQAYEELRFIFAIAIETQDFSTLEARISAWENKYPLADFTDQEIIRKIKTILNKDFLTRLIGDYLAAKILHEQEKQKQAYDSLKEIIDTAKKTKDYKTAQKEVRKWKEKLYEDGFNLYGFNRLYRARICTLLLLPSKELKNQEQATDELKKIKENGQSMNSEDFFDAISNWQNTYSIADFPDKLQKELNQITTEVFDSIALKRTSENAIFEIEQVLASKNFPLPANAIASILSKYDYNQFEPNALARIQELSLEALSIQDDDVLKVDLSALRTMSPVETSALSSLIDILNKSPNDMDTILNWIYVNRKISYSEYAREKIIKQFLKVGYKVPAQDSYAIPEINSNLDLSKINDMRKDVILNYLGILSQGNKLTLEGKDNIIEAHALSTTETLVHEDPKTSMFLEAFDTVVEKTEEHDEMIYNEKGEISIDKEEEAIYNLLTEDLIENPLVTYPIANPQNEPNAIEETPQVEPTDTEAKQEIEQSTADKSAKTIVTKQITDELEAQTESSAEYLDSKYVLTSQDEENLEQAYTLSTYIVIASPILAKALEPQKTKSSKKLKFNEIFKDL